MCATFLGCIPFLRRCAPHGFIPLLWRGAPQGRGGRSVREKLLHQPFFMGFECGDFLGLGGDEVVERSEAIGYFLLFFNASD